MGYLNISDAELKKSATTFQKELLITPVISCSDTLQHFTGRPGVAGRQVIGQLTGNIELGPYNAKRVDDTGVNLTPRVLETYLGSVVKRFDPNEAAKTVWGEAFAQGEELTRAALVLQVLTYLSAQLGKMIGAALWTAERDASGDKTKNLFAGFDTITKKEIDASSISTTQGNLHEFPEAFSDTNTVDLLMKFYEGAAPELQAVETKLYIPHSLYNAYNRDYATRFGSTPYNHEYSKTFLEGTQNLCELVPLASKKGTEYVHLSTKKNMLYGYGAGMADENIAIEKYHEFLISFVATMYFGVQFETIAKESLFVGKIHA
ncbi:MAG: hypothetical protein HXL29_00780 [Prevotellaceae bacterium]|nr:hypothetical protein [Prevotellaceae bacterium]